LGYFHLLLSKVATTFADLRCSFFTRWKEPMTDRYEITRSHGASLIMIFRAGEWDSLPFEIRLLQPWYGSEFLDRTRLITQQRLDIARQGYTMVESQPAACKPSSSRWRHTDGACACPEDMDRAGQRCGKRSAYARSGGMISVCARQ
jgi:hypothetical protein